MINIIDRINKHPDFTCNGKANNYYTDSVSWTHKTNDTVLLASDTQDIAGFIVTMRVLDSIVTKAHLYHHRVSDIFEV